MADIRQVFTGDISDFENKLAKLQASYLKLKETLGQTKRESREGADAFARGIGDQVMGLGSLVTGLLTVKTAVGMVGKGFAEWGQIMDETAAKAKERQKDMLSGLAALGNLAAAPQIEAWLGKGGQGATRAQMLSAMTGAAGGAPTAGFQSQREIAEQTLRAAPFMDVEQLKGLATTAGRMKEFMPGKGAGEILSMLTAMRRTAGVHAEELTGRGFMGGVRSLVESGAATPEEALALGTTAAGRDISPQIVERMAAKVAAPEQVQHRAGHMTETDRIKARFAAAPASERWKMLLEDEQVQVAVGGERLAGRLGRITPEDVQAQAEMLSGAQTTDMFGQDLLAGKRSAAGRAATRAQDNAVLEDEARAALEPEARARAGRETRFAREQMSRGPLTAGAARAGFWLAENIGASVDDLGGRVATLVDKVSTNQATNAATMARVNGNE